MNKKTLGEDGVTFTPFEIRETSVFDLKKETNNLIDVVYVKAAMSLLHVVNSSVRGDRCLEQHTVIY